MSESSSGPVVRSYNEWDLLEEVIVGGVRGAMIPVWDELDYAAHPVDEYAYWHDRQNQPVPEEEVSAATRALDELAHILEAEGVRVHRPDPFDFSRPYSTPQWTWKSGFNAENPRDLLIVIGDEIIEAPTPRRGRVHEASAYRSALREVFQRGGRYVSAPRPLLADDQFIQDFPRPKRGDALMLKPDQPMKSPLTEIEPVFEAADFMRCGKDIFYHTSFVTNQTGVDWLARHVGDAYRFHAIETRCRRPFHIDTTFVPIAPGKAIANPEFAPLLPPILKKWDVMYAPKMIPAPMKSPLQTGSNWLGMNLFSLDEERMFVDALQEELIRKLRDWGMKPIPIHFHKAYAFGGGLHCATLDVRRRGELKSYF
jgi:glycine amidinotransferase